MGCLFIYYHLFWSKAYLIVYKFDNKLKIKLNFLFLSDDDCSIGSTHTLTNENLNDLDNPARNSIQITPNSNDSLTSEAQSGSPPSNSISLPITPHDTPIPARRLPTRDRFNSETKSMNGKSRKKKLRDVSPVREEDSTETDTDSFIDRRSKALSASNATLTNVSLIILLYTSIYN